MTKRKASDSDLPSNNHDIGSFFGAKPLPRQQSLKKLWKPAAGDEEAVEGAVESDGIIVQDASPKVEEVDEKKPLPDSLREHAPSPTPDIDNVFSTNTQADLIKAATLLAKAHHQKYDPSHDFFHVERVTALALRIAVNEKESGCEVDLLVVQLAALFHDLLDGKYLPPEKANVTALEHLAGFWDVWSRSIVTKAQIERISQVMENVSYSKEVKRIQEGKQTAFHETCIELHCVQDADKLDAMGAIGIMRCAAYSAVASRPLYLPPSPTPSSIPPKSNASALDHFREKLFKLEGLMRTSKGKEMARRRTEFLRTFVDEIEHEGVETFG